MFKNAVQKIRQRLLGAITFLPQAAQSVFITSFDLLKVFLTAKQLLSCQGVRIVL